MAGNAKEYKDLQQATAVNNTDLFAVAQEDSNELKTVTTEQVAERVAEIVSTDQVQELISDLAMGKQVLAQALNNKGANATASDTLTTMASKLQEFDVVGAQEYIDPIMGKATLTSDPFAYPGAYVLALPYKQGLFCVDMASKTVAFVNKLEGSEAWNVVSSLVDNEMQSTILKMTYSKDCSYVAVATHTSNAIKITVYHISDEGIVTKKGITIDSITASGDYSGIHITEDGSYVYFFRNTGHSNPTTYHRYDTETGEDVTFNTDISSVVYIENLHLTLMLNDETLLAIACTADTVGIIKGTIDTANNYITFSKVTILNARYVGYGTCPAIKDNLLFVFSTNPNRDGTATCYVYDLATLQLKVNMAVRRLTTQNSTMSTISWNDAFAFVQFIYDSVNKKYDIYSSTAGILTYDINSNTLYLKYPTSASYNNVVYNILLQFYGTKTNLNSYGGNSWMTYVTKDLRMYVGPVSNLAPTANGPSMVWSSTTAYIKYVPEHICLGVVYRRNSQEVVFSNSIFDDTLYSAGAYAIKSTEAVLDISQGEDA